MSPFNIGNDIYNTRTHTCTLARAHTHTCAHTHPPRLRVIREERVEDHKHQRSKSPGPNSSFWSPQDRNTQDLTPGMDACTRSAQDQAGQHSSMESPSQVESLLTVSGSWGRERQFSLKVSPLIRGPCFSGWPHTHGNGGSIN